VLQGGSHRFTIDGSHLSSGVYFIRSETKQQQRLLRITLLK